MLSGAGGCLLTTFINDYVIFLAGCKGGSNGRRRKCVSSWVVIGMWILGFSLGGGVVGLALYLSCPVLPGVHTLMRPPCIPSVICRSKFCLLSAMHQFQR